MNSKQACDYLDEYFDGELAESLKADFEKHLDSCAACRATVEETRKIERLLSVAWNRVELVESNPQVVRQVNGTSSLRTTDRFRLRFELIAALAATVLIIVGLAWYWSNEQPFVAEVNSDRGTEQIVESKNNIGISHLAETEEQVSKYRPSYASADFDGLTKGVKIETNPQFTVYQVVPKVTFRHTN